MSKPVPDLELCYVEGSYAYFVEDHMEVWGDDWDDAPYEHNCGEPYGRVYVIMFDSRTNYSDGFLPQWPDSNHCNSPYSVEGITRRKECPWLKVEAGEIHGGQTVREFRDLMLHSDRVTTPIGWEGSSCT